MKKTEKQLLKELRISSHKAKINKIFQKYLNQILIFVGVVIFLMLAVTIKSSVEKSKQKKYSEKFYSAVESLEDNNITNAKEIFNEIYQDKKTPKQIRFISGIKLARLEIINKNNNEAINIYKDIYKNISKHNKDLYFVKYLAGTSAVALMINQQNEGIYLEIDKLLNENIDKKNPLINLSMEQKGLFEIQKGNLEEGMQILTEILQKDTLDTNSRQRIKNIMKANQ